MMHKKSLFRKIFRPVHEGDETFTQDQMDAAVKEGAEAAVAEATKGLQNTEQVNKIVEDRLARDREKRSDDNKKLISDLEVVRKQAGTSNEQSEALKAQIKRLQDETQTKEQGLARDLTDATTRHEAEVKTLTGERDRWKDGFTEQMMETAIRSAATTHNATPQAHKHLVAILGSMNARVIPVLDEGGKETGTYQPVVTFEDVDAEGKSFTTESMKVLDAVERMKALKDLYGNLFKDTLSGGLGGNSGAGAGSGTPATNASIANLSPSEHRKLRAEGKLPHQQG